MSDPGDGGDRFSVPEPPPYEAPAGRVDPAAGEYGLAEWWQRVVAIIIDGILLVIVLSVFARVLDIDTGGWINVRWQIISLIGGLLYYGFLNGSENGQTLGKMAIGIRVRDADTGGPIGTNRGFAREFVVWLLGLPFGILALIDGLWPLWDERRQSWHDKAVNSIVVKAK